MVLTGYRTIPGLGFRLPHAAYRGLYGMGDVSMDATDTSWLNQLPTWIQQLQTSVNTQRLLDLNIQRAQSGLPPITAQSVAPTLNFGLSDNTQQLIIYAGLALLAFTLLKKV